MLQVVVQLKKFLVTWNFMYSSQ